MSSQYHKTGEESLEKLIFAKGNKVVYQISSQYLKGWLRKVRKTKWTDIFAKGNNSSKTRSTKTKVKLNLYHVKTKSYTKFQVNISKDDREKFAKPSGRTFLQRAITQVKVGQPRQKSDLICIMSRQNRITIFNNSKDDWEKFWKGGLRGLININLPVMKKDKETHISITTNRKQFRFIVVMSSIWKKKCTFYRQEFRAFSLPEWKHSKECMCFMQNRMMSNDQESETTGLTEARRSDHYVPLCLTGGFKRMDGSHSAILQLYSDGTVVKTPNFDLHGQICHGQLGFFSVPSLPWYNFSETIPL